MHIKTVILLGNFFNLVCVMLLICHNVFYSTFFYVFYFFIKNAFFNVFFILGVNVFFTSMDGVTVGDFELGGYNSKTE